MSDIFNPPTNQQLPAGRPNGWVILDCSWARALGVQRDRGVYRIRQSHLLQKLERLGAYPPLGRWEIDPAHTSVGFVAPHLKIAKVRGGFREVSGTVSLGPTPAQSWVDVTVQTASIDTGHPFRDAHLRSEDFLDAANHPQMRFRSTGMEDVGTRSCKLTGDLTLRGVTRPVTLDLSYLGTATDTSGDPKVVFEASARIDREEFGLVWNRVLEAGGVLVGRHIDLQIEAQAVPAAA